MEIHDPRIAPTRQTTSTILGTTALTFAILLGFIHPSWALQVSPSALNFSATIGGTDPSTQTVVLSSNRERERTWTATENAPWVTVTPSSGTIATETDTVSVRASAAGLTVGSYSTNVMITETSRNGRIRRTILPVTLSVTGSAAAPAIQLSVSSLTFSGTVGGATPAPNTFSIANSGGGTLSWAANDNAAWLTLSPLSGTNSGSVTASVNLTGLAAGTYSTTITVTAAGAATKTIPVTLTVTAPGAPAIGLNPTSLTFTGATGGTNPAAQPINISNTGGGTLSWTANDNAAWLTLSPLSGTNSGSVTASVNLTGLAAGPYSTTITITAAGAATKTVPVTLTVTASTAPAIGLNPTSLTFTGATGGTNPAAKPISISNTGGGTLSWTANDNAAWLTLSPLSGTNSGSVTASVNLTGLAAGTYSTAITVTAPGATSQTVPVTLTVTALTTPAIGLNPTSLTFTGTTGGTNPAAKSISISNTGGGTLSWTASDNVAWLTLSPVSGTNNGTLTASVNVSGLAAGTYNGIITVTAAGSTNTPRQIPVTLTLSAAAANSATLMWNAGTESDLAGYKVYRGTGSGNYGAPLATLPKTTTSYVATGLQNGTTYFFAITAYDSAGNESSFSNEVSKSIF